MEDDMIPSSEPFYKGLSKTQIWNQNLEVRKEATQHNTTQCIIPNHKAEPEAFTKSLWKNDSEKKTASFCVYPNRKIETTQLNVSLSWN